MRPRRQAREKKVKIIKAIIIIIPILILGYVITQQFLLPKEFTYFYDIGSDKDTNYLTPNYRVTDKIYEEVDYRELTSGLVYFYIVPPRGYEDIYVEAKIKDNFPDKQKISIGIRDQQEVWHYKYKPIYEHQEGNEWINVNTTFNKKEDNLTLLTNGQLSILFNTPHLGRNDTMNYTIPVDWISIRVYKPGILGSFK